MNLLVLNCGSSSIKFAGFRASPLTKAVHGHVEAIGTQAARLILERADGKKDLACPGCDYWQALETIAQLAAREGFSAPEAVGHRVVHGGERFQSPAVIDEAVLAALEQTLSLAPLHNPANLEGIRLARLLWPQAVQVAAFDTAFHHTLPPWAYAYAVPQSWYADLKIRRYGFHGLSHAYVAKRAALYLGKPLSSLKLISFHLGSGASACAVSGGQSVDTSMGFTPLEGLVMGTRCGDLDPGVLLHVLRQRSFASEALEHALNEQSGLLGLCGHRDMRQVHQAIAQGDERAVLAFRVFCYRIKKYLGAYLAVLGGADAVIFTGGIGENDPKVREESLSGLERLGIAVDPDKNRQPRAEVIEIQSKKATIPILVIATDEEREIAEILLQFI